MLDQVRSSQVSPLSGHPPIPPTGPAALAPTTPPEGGDRVALAARARELSLAREAARQAPDSRVERVAALRQRIADGTYRVPDNLLAQKLLEFIA